MCRKGNVQGFKRAGTKRCWDALMPRSTGMCDSGHVDYAFSVGVHFAHTAHCMLSESDQSSENEFP